jgi:probable F420-dependent oxidoreductase
MTRRFRFGMQLAEGSSKADWIEQARLAEQLGYDIVVVPDHVGDQLAPFPALVSAAEATDRIRLGTFVIDNDFRHPMLLAQEAATVDLLTGGRFELGIGAGWMSLDYRRLGATFDPPGVRLQRLKESVEILGHHFIGKPFSFEGVHYQVTDAEPTPMPTQRPRPPLLIGGGGPQLLTFAAQQADIVSVFIRSLPDGSGFDVSELTAASYQETTDHVRRVAGDRRGQEAELNVLLQYFEVTNDRKSIAEEHARKLGIDPEDLLALPFELIGTVGQIVEDLTQRRERFGISYITVLDKYMRDFVPVIERLSGA